MSHFYRMKWEFLRYSCVAIFHTKRVWKINLLSLEVVTKPCWVKLLLQKWSALFKTLIESVAHLVKVRNWIYNASEGGWRMRRRKMQEVGNWRRNLQKKRMVEETGGDFSTTSGKKGYGGRGWGRVTRNKKMWLTKD